MFGLHAGHITKGGTVDQDALRAMLNRLFAERKDRDRHYSLGQFGSDLASMVKRSEPYKRQYIANVLKGVKGYPVSAELAAGLGRLAQVDDGVSQFQASLVTVPSNTLSMHELHEGSIIMGQSVLCATPGCGVWFVSTSTRRYCPKCHPPRKRT